MPSTRRKSTLFTLARKLLPAGQGIAHQYKIIDADGDSVGSIEGDFALLDFDQYEITLTDTSSIPMGPVVIGAIVIDAIQGN